MTDPTREAARSLSNERGLALLIAILLFLSLSAVATAMVITSQGDHLISANERDSERALLASRAGINQAYLLVRDGLLLPDPAGVTFDSPSDPAATSALEGATFTGSVTDVSAATGQGNLYRIDSTGVYNNASRETELTFQIVPEYLLYGQTAFDQAVYNNPSGLSGSSYRIDSTILSNGDITLPNNLTVQGPLVAANTVLVGSGATVEGDVFANSVSNSGSIQRGVVLLSSVETLAAAAGSWDVEDFAGNRFDWHSGLSAPGALSGSGTTGKPLATHTIADGERFDWVPFRPDGSVPLEPGMNVTKFVPPPRLDYRAMEAEAQKNDVTFFTSKSDAMAYLAGKKVVQTIGSKTVTTIRVGSAVSPEFLYVQGDFTLTLDPSAGADDLAAGILVADGFNLEGGLYASGDVRLNGPQFDPAVHPSPPAWYQFRINALPYCYPAVIAYSEPSTGSLPAWDPNDTPVMTATGSKLAIDRDPLLGYEGPVRINGLTYSQGETHLHHSGGSNDLIEFTGAQLGWLLNHYELFSFLHDPQVRCTMFLVADEGEANIVAYREIR